jgi:hypothetical protein
MVRVSTGRDVSTIREVVNCRIASKPRSVFTDYSAPTSRARDADHAGQQDAQVHVMPLFED